MTSPLTCMVCSTELRSSANFCDGCGSPIASAGIPAEYKQVTVLFADVVRSMDVAAAVGAERLREIMTELINRSAAVVQRYGGTLDKFTGDGLMAVFGRRPRWRITRCGRVWQRLAFKTRPKGLPQRSGSTTEWT